MGGILRSVVGVLFALLVSVVGYSWTGLAAQVDTVSLMAARNVERLAVVETRSAEQDRRLQRIEEKLDLLLEDRGLRIGAAR